MFLPGLDSRLTWRGVDVEVYLVVFDGWRDILAYLGVDLVYDTNRQDDEKQELLGVGDGPVDSVHRHAGDEEGFPDGGPAGCAPVCQVRLEPGRERNNGPNGEQLGTPDVILLLFHERTSGLYGRGAQPLPRGTYDTSSLLILQ